MQSADVFRSLGLGITFDKRRFAKDIALFSGEEGGDEVAKEAASPRSDPEDSEEEESPSAVSGGARPPPDGSAAAPAAGITLFSSGGAAAAAVFPDTAPKLNSRDPNEEANVIRKMHRIRISGSAPPAPLRSFAQLAGEGFGASTRLLDNMATAGWREPTPIQRQAIPALLGGRDLLALAPTGSGKTLGFLVPVLIAARAQKRAGAAAAGPRALVLSPTRELMAQSARVLQLLLPSQGLRASLLSKATAAGTDFSKVDILLANPMRLVALVDPGRGRELNREFEAREQARREAAEAARAERAGTRGGEAEPSAAGTQEQAKPSAAGTQEQAEHSAAGTQEQAEPLPPARLHLSSLRFLVMDEADKLFDMGFAPQVDAILAAARNKDLVHALFSATLPEPVEALARSILRDPLRVTVGERGAAASTVTQSLQFVGRDSGKPMALRQLLSSGVKPPILVFVSARDRAKYLYRELRFDGMHVDCIHSDQSDAARAAAIANFRSGATWVLIATDLLGRGMDFPGVNTVVNYDCPSSTTEYVHRVGRTGRAGRHGTAVTFFTEADAGSLRSIANVIKASGSEVPDWMLTLKKQKKWRKREDPMPGQDPAPAAKKTKISGAKPGATTSATPGGKATDGAGSRKKQPPSGRKSQRASGKAGASSKPPAGTTGTKTKKARKPAAALA